MPYKSVKELPESVRNSLPTAALRQFMHVVNSALSGGASEESAFKQAWSVIKRRFKKSESGKWVKMAEDFKYIVPFSSDEWKLFFPLGTVYHRGRKIEFKKSDAEEMLQNFKKSYPDYPLPVGALHKDELGVYGHIADMRTTKRGVEWKPEFRPEKEAEIAEKGWKHASPEIIFKNWIHPTTGEAHNNVAVGIALTPRPRLGRATAVFSEESQEWEMDESDITLAELIDAVGIIQKFKNLFRGDDEETDEFGDLDKAREAQKSRSKTYGIAILPQGHLTKPGKWSSLSVGSWGDPVNWRYPIHDVAHARNAASRFAQESNKGYKGRSVIAKRIEAAKRKFKVGEFRKEDHMGEELNEEKVAQSLWDKMKDLFPKPEELKVEELKPEPQNDFSEQIAEMEEKLNEFTEKLAEKETEIASITAAKEKAEKEAQEFSEQFIEEEQKRRLAEFTEQAEKLNVPVKAEEFAEVLMHFHDADDSEEKTRYAVLVSVLEAKGNADTMSNLFEESGTDAVGASTEDRLGALVKERMAKFDEDYATAATTVLQMNPEIYNEYNKGLKTQNIPTNEGVTVNAGVTIVTQ